MKERGPVNRRDESPFDIFSEEYDGWFEQEGRTIFDIEVRAFREVLPSLEKPWIEIGVGSGRFAEALGIQTGIEPSGRLGEMAGLRGVRVIRGNAEDVSLPERSFKTAFIIVTLCFVDKPELVLERTADMLTESGKLVLGLITMESPWAAYYLKKKEAGHPFYSIATFYGYSRVLDLLEGSGFVHERTVSTLFQLPGLVDHIEPPREGFFPESGFIVVLARKK